MNLELAHRLNLIQRQIEHAQLMLETAAELMNVVMSEAHVDTPTAPTAAKTEAEMPVVKQRRQKLTPMQQPPYSAIVREFLASHTDNFTPKEMMTWAKAKGYSLPRKGRALSQALWGLANQRKEVIAVGKGTGIYKKVA